MSFRYAFGDTYRKLVKAWRKARKEEGLIPIEENFFLEVRKNLDTLEREVAETQTEESVANVIVKNELHLIKFLLYDLIKIRTWKLAKAVMENESVNELLPSEQEFTSRLEKDIDRFKENLVSGSSEGEIPSLQIDDQQLRSRRKDLVLVVAKDTVESFVTEEGVVYKKIEKGDVLNIPEQNFNLFKKRAQTLFEVVNVEEEH